jgi:hypothetical protein
MSFFRDLNANFGFLGNGVSTTTPAGRNKASPASITEGFRLNVRAAIFKSFLY